MKLNHTFVMFVLCIGLFANIISDARAEVITIDGTIKSVDANKRTITVETDGEAKTLDVSSKAKISTEGKDSALDSLKPGQNVKLSYHDELEIVLKIEVGTSIQSPDATKSESSKTSRCRVVWHISETGESTLIISPPLKNRSKATDSLIRHEDGTVEFQHDLDTEDSARRVLMGGMGNVDFDKTKKTLVFTPKSVEGHYSPKSGFNYSKLAGLPLTMDCEIEATGEPQFYVGFKNQTIDREYPFLNVKFEDDFFQNKLRIQVIWHSAAGQNGKNGYVEIVEEQFVKLQSEKKFAFTIPMNPNHVFQPTLSVNSSSVSMNYLSFRGRLTPAMGIALAKKNDGVIAENVSPKGLGDTVGIKNEDVIVSINRIKPASLKEALELFGKIQFGEESEIVVNRNGKTVKIGFTAE